MIIDDDDQKKDMLLAWDYNSPLTFPLPLGAIKYDLRIGTLLPRILNLCTSSTNEKIKAASGELIHGLVVYLIGKSAETRNFGNIGNKGQSS